MIEHRALCVCVELLGLESTPNIVTYYTKLISYAIVMMSEKKQKNNNCNNDD